MFKDGLKMSEIVASVKLTSNLQELDLIVCLINLLTFREICLKRGQDSLICFKIQFV